MHLPQWAGVQEGERGGVMNYPPAFHQQSDRFHEHLDVCKQCEEHPFDLCPTGQKIMADLAKSLEGKHDDDEVQQGAGLPRDAER